MVTEYTGSLDVPMRTARVTSAAIPARRRTQQHMPESQPESSCSCAAMLLLAVKLAADRSRVMSDVVVALLAACRRMDPVSSFLFVFVTHNSPDETPTAPTDCYIKGRV